MRPLLVLCALLLQAAAWAGGPVKWTFGTSDSTDGSARVLMTAICEEHWHLYAMKLPNDEGPLPTTIRLAPSGSYQLAGDPQEPQPTEIEDPNFMMLVRYHAGEVVFSVPIKRTTKEAFVVEGEVEFMCCNDKMCLPPEVVKFSVQFPALK
jgi:thiol:disulfide interchange protein DsbD